MKIKYHILCIFVIIILCQSCSNDRNIFYYKIPKKKGLTINVEFIGGGATSSDYIRIYKTNSIERKLIKELRNYSCVTETKLISNDTLMVVIGQFIIDDYIRNTYGKFEKKDTTFVKLDD